MILFVMLIAGCLSIHDAAQLDAYKPDYDNLIRNEKRDYCDVMCPCPLAAPSSASERVLFSGNSRSKLEGKNVDSKYPKRSDGTSPREVQTVYSMLNRDGVNYLAPILRKVFERAQ